ncbi:MAG: TIGR04372 family glycosyltransferase [Parachlamydia sp.]|nr:TIGR04372 family glycosyltransferase [Parachlamydia sp.]
MHYAECWHLERGPVCLVVFISCPNAVVQLAKLICPNVEIIVFNNLLSRAVFFIFRGELIQFDTLNRIYAYACCCWPHALFIFDTAFCRKIQKNNSCYISAFDPVLKDPWLFSAEFLKTYLQAQTQVEIRKSVYQDMIKLFNLCASKTIKTTSKNTRLIEKLKIDTPYVVMNVNCKDYHNKSRNIRTIHYPERYNSLINFLISKGYFVVIQGRKEQPSFAPRKGLIEYFKSSEVSAENDYWLFSQCAFAIMPKTGPEIFSSICNIPVLGLNYTEFTSMNQNNRSRFFPKHLWDSEKQKFIHWKDLLQRPCFFNIGSFFFEEGIEYVELEEEELLTAAEEFLQLLPQPFAKWEKYTPLQEEFKRSLHPAHIGLYDITGVPCEAYLSSQKYTQKNVHSQE